MSKRFWKLASRVCGLDLYAPQSDLVAPETSFSEDLEVIALRARAWAREMPCAHDIFLGNERTTLMAANVLASRLGRGVASCELFGRGHYWISGQVKDDHPDSALVIAMRDPAEVEGDIAELQSRLPELQVDIGVLFPLDGGSPRCVMADSTGVVSH